MQAKHLRSILFAAVLGAFVAGCGTYAGRSGEVVPSAPPPPPAEVDMTSPMPGRDYLWVGGAWVWSPENKWQWAKGHWEQRPFLDAVWVPPRCENRNGKYFFVPGRWN